MAKVNRVVWQPKTKIVSSLPEDGPSASDSDSLKTKRKPAAKRGTKAAAASTPDPSGPALYQIKITLKGSKPPIWRRLLMRSNTRLDIVHLIFQAAMGWENYHLHEFRVGEDSYGEPEGDDGFYELDFKDECDFTLADIAPLEKAKFSYIYDFGDGWIHDVVIEKVLPFDPKFKHSVCLAGAMRCPMEDSGGIWGYYNKLEALADRKHEDHDDIKEWIGGRKFDPTAFDLKKVNARLKLA